MRPLHSGAASLSEVAALELASPQSVAKERPFCVLFVQRRLSLVSFSHESDQLCVPRLDPKGSV